MALSASLQCSQPEWGWPHCLRLPAGNGSAVAAAATVLADAALQQCLPPPGPVRLEAGPRALQAGELQQLAGMLRQAGLELVSVASNDAGTRVATAGLGLHWEAELEGAGSAGGPARGDTGLRPQELTIHQGTLRSGDHLEAEGSVLVLGDVNPGARVSAGGHVLIWGQLRGIAHAGSTGLRSARIVALQLRPLQLRIAELVARGPADPPPQGLAEQAVIEAGAIAIQPARPQWPLGHGASTAG